MSEAEALSAISNAVSEDRLIATARELVDVPSPTRSAAAVADRLAEMLTADGFSVERADCGWPDAPAVICRYDSGQPGRTLQFNGHLDTVHLPFVPSRVEDGLLFGSGASDMKGGIAAAVEAMRAVRDSGQLQQGSILLTAHELHEAPWGDGSQVDGLIESGFVGDAVLLPEYCHDPMPIAGRGLAVLEITISRDGDPVHEVLGGIEAPSVILAGAEIVRKFADIDESLKAAEVHETAGRASLFLGQINAGEIFNQSPTELKIAGTRRWLPGTDVDEVKAGLEATLVVIAERHGVHVDLNFQFVRDAYEIDPNSSFAESFQSAHEAVVGARLATGPKPFVDDGNTFVHRGGIPAITHGPNALGAHTVNEEVPVSELVRVAKVYALTALDFC